MKKINLFFTCFLTLCSGIVQAESFLEKKDIPIQELEAIKIYANHNNTKNIKTEKFKNKDCYDKKDNFKRGKKEEKVKAEKKSLKK